MLKLLNQISILFMLTMGVYCARGQNITLDVNTICPSTISGCNPFLNALFCGPSSIRTTHGSPQIISLASKKNIELLSLISGSVSYGEGFTMAYTFVANITYTVKITQIGKVNNQSRYPKLIASILNSPPRYDDGCDLGYLTSTSVYMLNEFNVSATQTVSTFEFTPTSNQTFLWLSAEAIYVDECGINISKIEIVDHSIPVTPPVTPPAYACPGASEFDICHPGHGGGKEYHITEPVVINCDAFTDPGSQPDIVARFVVAPSITLTPGFVANTTNTHRLFHIKASNTPCAPFRVFVNDTTISVSYPVKVLYGSKIANGFAALKNISVYPVPSTDVINIVADKFNMKGSTVSIYDQNGKQVLKTTNNSETSRIKLNLEGLKNGIYYLKFNSGIVSETKKIILSR